MQRFFGAKMAIVEKKTYFCSCLDFIRRNLMR